MTFYMKSVWTDLLQGEFFQQTPETRNETEMLNMSFSVELTHRKNNRTEVCVAETTTMTVLVVCEPLLTTASILLDSFSGFTTAQMFHLQASCRCSYEESS